MLSRAIVDDPAVRPLLQGVPARTESVALKGFAEPISFVRLVPTADRNAISPAASRPAA